ncbi:DNA glycosylase AlkZ-like family protein [Streptomyces sp. NPDC059340]|uniref:DNA glycosylase AlkZ-like family protein n=1 Tax=Streptomyces sp. NPDC059340 TaxID=3346806 RepID=UPI0036CA5617
MPGRTRQYIMCRPAAPGSAAQEADAGVLLLAYLQAFGPASAQDFARFTLLTRTAITQALHELGDQVLRVTGRGRAALFDVGDATVPAEDTPAPPRLLPMWDSIPDGPYRRRSGCARGVPAWSSGATATCCSACSSMGRSPECGAQPTADWN